MLKNNVLLDLYVTGKEVTLGDDNNIAKVWIQKLNPNEHETITRKADAARARAIAKLKDTESEQYQAIYSNVWDMDKDQLVEYLVNDEIREKISAVESKVSEFDEWTNENYLQGLRDSWTGGLADAWISDQEDPEASHVYEELKRFAEQVAHEVEAERADLSAAHYDRTLEKLNDAVIEVKCREAANIEWLKVYRKGELIYAVRDAKKRHVRLLDWDSVDAIQQEAYERLTDELRALNVPVVEGKD